MEPNYDFAMTFARPFTISSMRFGEAFQSSFFLGKTHLSRFVQDLHWLLFLFGTSSLVLLSLVPCTYHLVSMVHERDRSHRGSAWDAHRA
jgi:hypothetical protein